MSDQFENRPKLDPGQTAKTIKNVLQTTPGIDSAQIAPDYPTYLQNVNDKNMTYGNRLLFHLLTL